MCARRRACPETCAAPRRDLRLQRWLTTGAQVGERVAGKMGRRNVMSSAQKVVAIAQGVVEVRQHRHQLSQRGRSTMYII